MFGRNKMRLIKNTGKKKGGKKKVYTTRKEKTRIEETFAMLLELVTPAALDQSLPEKFL